MIDNFYHFKATYLLHKDFEGLANMCVDDSIMRVAMELPNGWWFKGYSVVAHAGFVLLFDIDYLPTQEQLGEVDTYLKVLEENIKQLGKQG